MASPPFPAAARPTSSCSSRHCSRPPPTLASLPNRDAQLAIETVLGAAALAAQSSDPASLLRERVTSKGGTTEAALRTMAEKGVKEGIVAGVKAAEARGRELGRLLGGE